MPSYCILVPDCKQVALAKVEGYVNAVARLERKETHDPCRDGYATIWAEGDVGEECDGKGGRFGLTGRGTKWQKGEKSWCLWTIIS